MTDIAAIRADLASAVALTAQLSRDHDNLRRLYEEYVATTKRIQASTDAEVARLRALVIEACNGWDAERDTEGYGPASRSVEIRLEAA